MLSASGPCALWSLVPHSPQRRVVTRMSLRNSSSKHSLSVAIIGAGAAGLVAARELAREGHQPVVYERGDGIGGVWRYTEETEDDPLCAAAARHRVHSSMYAGLRTNLPRQLMGFADYPFDADLPGSKDPRTFPGHAEVQAYLEAFAAHFGLLRYVRFGTEVLSAAPPPGSIHSPRARAQVAAGGAADGSGQRDQAGDAPPVDWLRWQLELREAGGGEGSSSGESRTEQHDAVIVCNGHYAEPRLPQFPGEAVFPGRLEHAHNYRRPDKYRGQVVVVVGAASSGVDISQEVAEVAQKVYLCARAWQNPLTGQTLDYGAAPPGAKAASVAANAVVRSANIQELRADGSVELADGTVIPHVDTIIYCTGYEYRFPFLNLPEVSVQGGCVGPLYKHVFPPTLAPTLAFIGLPFNIVPFPQFELQSKWIARVLSARARLPSAADMWQATEAFYDQLALAGISRQYAHRQIGPVQWAYNNWLAEQCGADVPRWPDWRVQLYEATGASRQMNFDLYRDVPLGEAVPAAAKAERAAAAEAAAVRQQGGAEAAVIGAS